MRKLKLQIQMSIDGLIAGVNSEMDWMVWDWSDELKNYVAELCKSTDCIILGANLAKGFIPHWASNPELEGASFFNETKKIVFSKSIEKNEWENTILEKGDLVEKIKHLKNQDGNDIIAYGGAKFVSSLIKAELIDEFHLFVNPSILGNGMPIFKDIENRQNLILKKSLSFNCGIVVIHYDLKK